MESRKFKTSHHVPLPVESVVHRSQQIPPFSLRKKSVLCASDFTLSDLTHLQKAFDLMQVSSELHWSLRGYQIALLFSEGSVVNRVAFESAVYRLGGNTIHINGEEIRLLLEKPDLGEAMKSLGGSVEAIVMCHPNTDLLRSIADASGRPVLNAGIEVMSALSSHGASNAVALRMALLELVLGRVV